MLDTILRVTKDPLRMLIVGAGHEVADDIRVLAESLGFVVDGLDAEQDWNGAKYHVAIAGFHAIQLRTLEMYGVTINLTNNAPVELWLNQLGRRDNCTIVTIDKPINAIDKEPWIGQLRNTLYTYRMRLASKS